MKGRLKYVRISYTFVYQTKKDIKTFFFPDSNLCYLKMRIHIFVMSKSESLCVRNGEPKDEPLLVWILAA